MELQIWAVTILPPSFITKAKLTTEEDDFDDDLVIVTIKFKEGMQMPFEWPTKLINKHLRPLYIKAHSNGWLVNKVLINERVAINLMLRSTFVWLGKQAKDLMPSNVVMIDFNGKMLALERMVLIDL